MTNGDPSKRRSTKSARDIDSSGKIPRDPARRPSQAEERVAIAGYHVLQILGRGSSGIVYRAIQLSMQREVALKVLSPDLARIPGFAERFVREARSAGAVHHPNVVTCYDVGEVDGVVYQALELNSGGDLGQLLAARGGALPLKDALGILIECARGLEGIHRAGMVHCDIKPSNIFITHEETVKLADLGLALSLASDERSPRLSASLADLATLAPEQFGGDGAPDIRVDTYALGATLFIATTGQQPFDAPDAVELERQILDAPVPDPRDYDPALPSGLAAVIAKAMAKDRQARYATPVQLREDLERLQFDFAPIHAQLPETRRHLNPRSGHQPGTNTVYGHATVLHDSSPPLRRERVVEVASLDYHPGSRRRLRVALGALVVGLVVALIAWWLLSRGATAVSPSPIAVHPSPTVVPAATTPAPIAASPTFAWAKPAWASARGEDGVGRWAELRVGESTQRLRYCPAGTFLMGTPSGAVGHRDDETQVRVTLSHGFWLGEDEVSQRLYQAVTGTDPSAFKGADLPVESVSWDDAQMFLQRLNAKLPAPAMRLPTEAEWEYAATAGTGAAPAAAVAAKAWTQANSGSATHAAGGFPADAWGFHDLLGNVMEWCQDFYAPYPRDSTIDPLGWQGISRVARGGAWTMPPGEVRVHARAKYLPPTRFFFLGFRLAASE